MAVSDVMSNKKSFLHQRTHALHLETFLYIVEQVPPSAASLASL